MKVMKKEWKPSENGYKVIKVEGSAPEEKVYAVCTPIKLK